MSPLLKQVAAILNPVVKVAPALIEPLYVMAQVKYLSGEPVSPCGWWGPWVSVCRLPAWDTPHTPPHRHSHQMDPLFPASNTPDSSPAGVSPTLPFADCLLDLCQPTVTELDDAPAVL